MIDRSFPMALFRSLTFAGLGLVLTGCGEELGPVPKQVARVRGVVPVVPPRFPGLRRQVPKQVARVRGVVREDRRPLSGGWIEFYPVDGTVGNLRSARIRQDGSFEADGVAVGANLIRFVNARMESQGAAQLFGGYSSPIRRVITDRSETPLDVDLVAEAIRYKKTQTRQKRAEPSGAGAPP
jgi:hypothetical protein